jgi:ABC-type Fe3+ transport system substrate-binding protein
MTQVKPAILVAITLAAWMGAAQAQSVDQIANYAGADRQAMLESGAKKEGEVYWTGSLSVEDTFQPAAEQFEKMYPGVKVKFVRADSSQIVQRLLAEKQARSIRTDVLVADITVAMKKADLAQPFVSPIMAEYPAQYIAKDKTWVSVRSTWQGIAWNTKLVSDAEAPKTWEALLDPKWKGKMVWGNSTGTGAPRLITHLRKIWGEQKALDYLEKLKGQDMRIGSGSIRNILDQVVAGEHAIGVSMAMHHIALSQSKGAPINGASPEPSMARGGTLQVVKGAPHPHAAMLLVDYILSKDGGQRIVRDSLENPGHPGVEPLPELRWIQPNLNGRTELLMDDSEVEEMGLESNEIFKRLFR